MYYFNKEKRVEYNRIYEIGQLAIHGKLLDAVVQNQVSHQELLTWITLTAKRIDFDIFLTQEQLEARDIMHRA